MILGDTASKFLACHRQCALRRTPSQGEKHILYIKVQPEDQITAYRGASLLEMKGRSHLRIFGSTHSEVKVKADIPVSIWLILHAKTSCCYRTNTKRKGWKIILGSVCGDNVSGNLRPAVVGTDDKGPWQISGHTRLQWLQQSLCSYFFRTSHREKPPYWINAFYFFFFSCRIFLK